MISLTGVFHVHNHIGLLKLTHSLWVEELELALLIDPCLSLLEESVENSGCILVLLSLLLRLHQLALQSLALVDRFIDVVFAHHLLHLVVLDLGLGPPPLTAHLE